jgi:hypothetical protein
MGSANGRDPQFRDRWRRIRSRTSLRRSHRRSAVRRRAVARRLAHRQIVFGVPGQDERGQPATHLNAQRRQPAGMRRPAAMHEFRRFALRRHGYRLAHVASSRAHHPHSRADCATEVRPPVPPLSSRLSAEGHRSRTRPAALVGLGVLPARRWPCSAPLRRCKAIGGSRRLRGALDEKGHRGDAFPGWIMQRQDQQGT